MILIEKQKMDLDNWIQKALEGNKFYLAKLVSLFENTRKELLSDRNKVIEILEQLSNRRGVFLGFTGTPGTGKSTLTGRIANELIKRTNDIRVGILAIDPSSEISGGSLLGDRTRVKLPVGENRIFFRSQASDKELGGLSRHSFSVCRLFYYFFDYIFIETVGIGQSEIEIQYIADKVFLVLQPLTGDQIQFMKAGVMEIPDAFVINKWDQEKEARKTYYALRSTLSLIYPVSKEIPIFRVSAHTGYGIDEFIQHLLKIREEIDTFQSMQKKEIYFFEKWVKNEYGRIGLEILKNSGGSKEYIQRYNSIDIAFMEFSKLKYNF